MPFSPIGSVSADGTTAALNTTGADLLVAVVGTDTASVTDSLGNTWTPLTERRWAGDGAARMFYCRSPIVGSAHTFSPGAGYRSICVIAFSGSAASSFFEAEIGGTGTTGLATGSITPSQADCLVVAGWGFGGNANTFSLSAPGFTLAQTNTGAAGSTYGSALAYQIQTTATAVNPSMSWSGGGPGGAMAAVFRAAPGGGGGGASATLAATEAGSDAATASAALLAQASMAASETGSDTAAASIGAAPAQASLAVTETGSDAATASAVATVQASAAAVETGSDAASGSAVLLAQASLTATETGSDNLAASAGVPGALNASMAAVEAGSDAAASSVAALIQAAAAAAEAAQADAAAAVVRLLAQASLGATEAGADTFTGRCNQPISAGATAEEVWGYTLSNGLTAEQTLLQIQVMLRELYQIHGLDPAAALIVSAAQRQAGAIVQAISTVGGTTTVTRV